MVLSIVINCSKHDIWPHLKSADFEECVCAIEDVIIIIVIWHPLSSLLCLADLNICVLHNVSIASSASSFFCHCWVGTIALATFPKLDTKNSKYQNEEEDDKQYIK